jgi:hypothetical protein
MQEHKSPDDPLPPSTPLAPDRSDDIPLDKPQTEPVGLPDLDEVGPGSTPPLDRPEP